MVTDSEDNHVGQVVIPAVSIESRPENSFMRPTDPSRLIINELEATKKINMAYGRIFYWLWAEEFTNVDLAKKGSSNSHLSVSK